MLPTYCAVRYFSFLEVMLKIVMGVSQSLYSDRVAIL